MKRETMKALQTFFNEEQVVELSLDFDKTLELIEVLSVALGSLTQRKSCIVMQYMVHPTKKASVIHPDILVARATTLITCQPMAPHNEMFCPDYEKIKESVDKLAEIIDNY